MNYRDFIPPILLKISQKLYILIQEFTIKPFLARVNNKSKLFPMKVNPVGNCKGNPTEFF